MKKCIQYKVEGSRGRLEDLERGCTVEKTLSSTGGRYGL